MLELPSSYFHSVITFVGDCTFKTKMPENVFCGLSYTKYIKSFKTECCSQSEVQNIMEKLQKKQLKQSFRTDHEHVNNIKQRFEKPTVTSTKPICQRCGSILVKRKNKTTGETFYGCSSYPRCKYTAQIN